MPLQPSPDIPVVTGDDSRIMALRAADPFNQAPLNTSLLHEYIMQTEFAWSTAQQSLPRIAPPSTSSEPQGITLQATPSYSGLLHRHNQMGADSVFVGFLLRWGDANYGPPSGWWLGLGMLLGSAVPSSQPGLECLLEATMVPLPFLTQLVLAQTSIAAPEGLGLLAAAAAPVGFGEEFGIGSGDGMRPVLELLTVPRERLPEMSSLFAAAFSQPQQQPQEQPLLGPARAEIGPDGITE